MNEEYLWDRSGSDPEIEDLERRLAPFRHGSKNRAAAQIQVTSTRRAAPLALAAAAAVLAAIVLSQAPPSAPAPVWQVARLAGAAHIGVRKAAVSMPVRAGQLLETGASAEISLSADDVGQIDIGPQSELLAGSDHKLLLRRGSLHAFIWAPPRQFVVDTPSARAIDLGCEYTLNVNSAGDGLLRVSFGWVAFQYADHESFIPAGAECVTRKRSGPGIPYYADAPQQLRQSLAEFEKGESEALRGILNSARPRDALTLWHLLTRAPEFQRGAVFDRFSELVALPKDVTREGVLRQDEQQINHCWDALNLENTEWWRGWERKWK
jgi:hypothetical protein